MKKKAFRVRQISLLLAVSFVIFALFLFSSCSAFSSINSYVIKLISGEYSESDADYALHKALENAIQRSADKLPEAFQNSDFLPPEYSFLKERTDIPGISALYSYARDYYAGFIRQNISFFKENISPLASTFVFRNPKKMVEESPYSATTAFLQLYRTSISSEYKKIFQNADNDFFDDIVSQYNAYALLAKTAEDGLSEHLGEKRAESGSGTFPNSGLDEDGGMLRKINASNYVAEFVCDLFFNLMRENEELYRTTPSVNSDKIAGMVFGIK